MFLALWLAVSAVFVLMRPINHLPLYIGPIFGKSIQNKLFCKFPEMENVFIYNVDIYILIVIIYICFITHVFMLNLSWANEVIKLSSIHANLSDDTSQ